MPGRRSRTVRLVPSCLASCRFAGGAVAAPDLPALQAGDLRIHDVSETRPASSRPPTGTIAWTVATLPFGGGTALAIATERDPTIDTVAIRDTTPFPGWIVCPSQDPATRGLGIIGDDAGADGGVRVSGHGVDPGRG